MEKKLKVEYPWPSPRGSLERPIWTGRGFRIGETLRPILSFDISSSGWTDELTDFHEEKAGADHFIDLASRSYALGQLQNSVHGPSPVILEVGCSSGFMLKLIQQHFPHSLIIGSDYVAGPLLRLAQEVLNIPLLHFDLTNCPLPDRSLDAVVLLNVLEHIADDGTAIAQVSRILKPGGIAVIEVPADPHLYDVYDKILMHHRRYSFASLKQLFKPTQLEVIRHSHLGCFPYPGFWWVKRKNRRFLSQEDSRQRAVVSQNIQRTKGSGLLAYLMRIELFLGKWISYPFGIRCLVTCRRTD